MRSSSVMTRLPRPPWRGTLRPSAAGSRCRAWIDDPTAAVDRPGDQPRLMFTAAAVSALPFLVFAFLAAAAVSLALTPLVRRIAIRYDGIDHPGLRRVNEIPVPRGGGVAVAIALVGVTLAFLALNAVVS